MCGSRGPFTVDASTPLKIEPNGAVQATDEKPEWFQRSGITCNCGFFSLIDEFFIAGLDRGLKQSGYAELSRSSHSDDRLEG